MRTQTCLLALAALTAGAGAQTVIEFNDVEIFFGQPYTATIVQEDPGPLLGFTWDLTYVANGISWGSELNIVLTHESGFTFVFDGSDANFADLGPADHVFGWGNFSGMFTSSDSLAVLGGPTETLGDWTITVFDEFEDIEPQGTLSGTITINKVPAPGGLAALGLAGALGLRRRRG